MRIHRILALLLKYWYISVNRIDRLFDIVFWPVLDIFVWGFASVYISGISDVNVLSVLLGGVILWLFVWRAGQDVAVFVLEDFWSRNLYHLFASPVTLGEHMASILLLTILRTGASFLFLSLVAWLLYAFNIFVLPWTIFALALTLLLFSGWVLGLFISSFILRYGQRIQVLAWSVVWIVQPFSCVFYPLSALPAWAKPIAWALPTTHVFEVMRYALTGSGTYNLWYAYTVAIVMLGVSAWFLSKSFDKARKTGLFTSIE